MNVAVIIPCFNEEISIAKVVKDFQTSLPQAKIFVFDNNSTDSTIIEAKKAGAEVFSVAYQGKGSVVRQAFADIEADYYIMVDGDNTYDASKSPEMLNLMIANNLDMVVGKRVDDNNPLAYRRGHRFGNKMLTFFVNFIFGKNFTDMLSGYRVFSRRFVKSFPVMSKGFEIETEINIHSLEMSMNVAEVDTTYIDRMEESFSKLSTYKDGFKILFMIISLFRYKKPLFFFSLISIFLTLIAFLIALPILLNYISTGLVPRFPSAFLSLGLVTIAIILFCCGLVLDAVARAKLEIKKLFFLQIGKTNVNK